MMTYDPQLELKYGIKLSELRDLMQLKSQEATQIIQTKYNGVEGLSRKLNADILNGLNGSEQDIKERQAVFGVNEIPPKPPKWFIQLVFEALQDVTLIILLVCAVISVGLSFYHPDGVTTTEEQVSYTMEQNLEWIEGIAIGFAVVVVVLMTAINDWRKERQFRGLQAQIEKETVATVIRNGEVKQINVKDLVVGDVCCIKYGDSLQADGVVIQSSDLKIDEAALTGETDLIKKNENHDSTVLSGTHVMEGSGKYLVTAVGLNSQNGIIFALLGAAKEDKKDKEKETAKPKNGNANGETPNGNNAAQTNHDHSKEHQANPNKHRSVLQAKLTSLVIKISYAGLFSALFTIIVLSLRFSVDMFAVQKMPWSNIYIKDFISFLIEGITVLVVTVPEGLPLAVTLSLAFAVRKMTFDNNLVRHLDACETMGSATTICSDKTGTLTTNRMTVVQCYIGGVLYKTIPSKETIPILTRDLIAESISINSNYTSKVEPPKQQGELPKQLGNKTECGLLGFVQDMGSNYETVRNENPTEGFEKVYTFNSARKMMSTIIKNKQTSGYRLFTKGASEMVLSKCSHYLNAQGNIEPFQSNQIDDIIKNVVEQMACEGLRTICVAYKDFEPKNKSQTNDSENFYYYDQKPDWDNETEVIKNLTCICLVGIEDPVRNEVPDAIKKCQKSGVVVRMVTGDNVNTATSIAIKCGIIRPGDNFLVLESKDFNKRIRDTNGEVSQSLLDEVWPKLRVLARSSPQDKYILVNGIVNSKVSSNREVVAVTGDGTNDGPALKRADVGFAMGIQGTDVAKEASDIILTDDNFSSIVKAMMWGRNVHDSIAKFLQFQLTVNLIAALVSVVCAATIKVVPLKAMQMLWVNLVMDTLGALALATEEPNEKLLERKPYGRTKPIITPMIAKSIAGQTIFQLAIIFGLVWGIDDWMLIDGVLKYNNYAKLKSASQHFTVIFNAFVMMTLFNEINARRIHGERNIFENIHKNPYFYVIWIICFIGQVIIVQFGSIVFSVEALEIDHWMWCLFFGFGTLLWQQLIVTIPLEWFEYLMFWNRKSHKVDSLKNGYVENNSENRNSDIDDLDKTLQSKMLWIRGIGRINNQLDVICAFQTRLEESKSRSLHGSNVSLKEFR